MIRIRSETGLRLVKKLWSDRLPSDWIRCATLFAYLQARSILETGNKKIPVSSAREIEPDLISLYEAGLIELLVWDEHDRTHKISKIRSVDLSLRAAEGLIAAGRLPKYFLPILLSADLIDNVSSSTTPANDLIMAEFEVWIDCGGLSDEQETMNRPSRRIMAGISGRAPRLHKNHLAQESYA